MGHQPFAAGHWEVEILAERDRMQQDRHVELLDRREEVVALGVAQGASAG
jgi:hypothetical protein